ncbi:MAG: AAA family ATPase [Calditrichaeota bacterium]|nr:AAA family ATPase [Calditrichota bacterium]
MSKATENLYIDFQRNRERLQEQLAQIVRRYGKPVFPEDNSNALLGSYVRAFFLPGEPRKFFISNTSLKPEYLDLTVRPAQNPSQVQLPNGVTLGIRGHLFPTDHVAPQLVVDRIVEVVAMPPRPFEATIDVNCNLSGDHTEKNILAPELIAKLPEIALQTRENLHHWRDYLDWKREIIERELGGIRYLDASLENEQLKFHVIAKNEQEFREMESLFREDSLSVFPLRYSQNEWEFRYARDNRFFSGVMLGDFRDAQPANAAAFKKLLRGCPWESPFVALVRFDLPADDRDQLPAMKPAERTMYLEQRMAQLPENGFLANSLIGDFTVLYRQQQALDMLERQSGFAPFISAWLFDIDKATPPQLSTPIDDWLMPNINAGQKRAVQKMLDAPDVALVQGPPGTGKTTVIGEAIYQLARQGKTVLLASQANLAVDNALEKLASVPDIRAIRLGRRHKLSAEGERFAEDRVLEKFYQSLADAAETQFLKPWQIQDAQLNALRDALDWFEIRENQLAEAAKSSDIPAEKSPKLMALEQLQSQVSGLLQLLSGDELAEISLPEKLAAVVENAFVNPLQHLSDALVDLLVPPFQPERIPHRTPIATQFPALWRAWLRLQSQLPDIRDAVAKIREPQQPDSEKISQLQQSLATVEAALESGDDSQLAEWRTLRRELAESSRSAKPNLKLLAEIFNLLPDLERRLSGDDSTRQQALTVVENGLKTIESTGKRIEKARAKLTENLREMLKNLEEKQQLLAKTAAKTDTKQREQRIKTQLAAELRERAQSWQSRGWLPEQTALDDPAAVRDELEHRLVESAASFALEGDFRERWAPFISQWHSQLRNPVQATLDHPHLIDTYLDLCNVVGVTCNENPRLLEGKNKHFFDVAIIDEVSKATPPELLMPMLLARKTILVGDHRQLPPLFKEREGSWEEALEDAPSRLKTLLTKENFYRFRDMVTSSLFKNYFEQAAGAIKETLLVQYRMHPQIMAVINHFYEHRLTCGLPEPDRQRSHGMTIPARDGRRFIVPETHALWVDTSRDAQGKPQYERQSGTSKINPLEATLMIELLRKIDAQSRKNGFGPDKRKAVGVISFYGRQIGDIRSRIRRERFEVLDIDVNTVDQFQGKEKSIILVSLVRHLPGGANANMQFVAQFERINVAFSRAQELLVIFGAKDTFAGCEVELPNMDQPGSVKKHIYGDIIESLKSGGRLFSSATI